MAFFTAWDYRHYSLVHADLESICYGKLVHLMENGELPSSNKPSQAGEACGMKPKFSRLSKQEHKSYLKLLHKYNNKVLTSPTAEERKEIETLASLQRRVVEEQKEFAQIFPTLPEVHERYRTVGSQARRFFKEHLEANLRRALRYPRHYAELQRILPAEKVVIPQFEGNVLQMGRCARLVRPNLNNHCQVSVDYEKLMGRFPPLDLDSEFHPSLGPASRDDLGLRLALKHEARALLDLDVLAALLDRTETQWDLPVVVRKDGKTERTVVCVDEPILRERLSPRDVNQMCYDYASRLRLTHVNVTRGREKKELVARPKQPRGRPRKTESPRKEAPSVVADDDIFGDAEDAETFGTTVEKKPSVDGGRKERVPLGESPEDGDKGAKRPDVVTESESPKSQNGNAEGVVDDGETKRSPDAICSCSARVVTRRTRQRCAHCGSRKDEDTGAKLEQTEENSGDSEDEALVIDEEATHAESSIVDIASPDGTPDRDVGAVGTTLGTPRIKLGEVDGTKERGSRKEASRADDNRAGVEDEGTETDSPKSPTLDEKDVGEGDNGKDGSCAIMEEAADVEKSSGNVGEHLPGILLEAEEGDGTAGFPPFPEAENVFYNVWTLGAVRLLLRHRAHALTTATKQTWSIFPKLEYNAHFGAEAFSEAELVRQMCYLIMIPNGHLLRVRIDAPTSGILSIEELGRAEFVGLAKDLSPEKLFGRAAHVLEQLCALRPGYYVSSRDGDEGAVIVRGCTNKRGGFDLHCVANRRAASAEDAPPKVLPLDPEVVLPNAYASGQIPLTFPPKDPKRPVLLVPVERNSIRDAKRFKGNKSEREAEDASDPVDVST